MVEDFVHLRVKFMHLLLLVDLGFAQIRSIHGLFAQRIDLLQDLLVLNLSLELTQLGIL